MRRVPPNALSHAFILQTQHSVTTIVSICLTPTEKAPLDTINILAKPRESRYSFVIFCGTFFLIEFMLTHHPTYILETFKSVTVFVLGNRF